MKLTDVWKPEKSDNSANAHLKLKLLIHKFNLLRQTNLPSFQLNQANHAHTKLIFLYYPWFPTHSLHTA